MTIETVTKLEALLGSPDQRAAVIAEERQRRLAAVAANLTMPGSGVPPLSEVLLLADAPAEYIALRLDNEAPVDGPVHPDGVTSIEDHMHRADVAPALGEHALAA